MEKSHNPERRRFMKTVGLGAAAAGAGVAVGHATLTQAATPKPDAPKAEEANGYRETDHIRAYYASLRD